MVTVFAPVWETTPEEYRRVTEVTYLSMVHGTMAALRHMRERNRGHYCSSRLRSGLSRHSAAGRLLRRQARAAWVYRFASPRARSRQQRGRGNRGRTAGGEYAAIRLGAHAHAAKATSGAAGGAAGSGCGSQLPRRALSEARILARREHAQGDPRQDSAAGIPRSLPGEARLRSAGDEGRGLTDAERQSDGAGRRIASHPRQLRRRGGKPGDGDTGTGRALHSSRFDCADRRRLGFIMRGLLQRSQ